VFVPYTLSLPLLILISAFFFLPILMLAASSFVVGTAENGRRFTSDIYWTLLSDRYTTALIFRTIKLSGISTLASLLIAFPVALHLRQMTTRWRSIVTLILLSPMLTSVVVRTLAWVILLGPKGIINNALVFVGLQPLRLIYNEIGIGIGLTHVFLGYMVLALMTSVSKIDENLILAASNLGASRWHIIAKIIIPLSLPGVVAGSILVFTMAASTYATPVLLGGSSVKVMAAEIYDRAINYIEFSEAAALSVILFAIIAAVVYLGTRLAERGRGKVIFQ